MNIQILITKKIKKAMKSLNISNISILKVHPTINKIFGDYQIDGIFILAKKLNYSPKILAEKIINFSNLNNIAKKVHYVDPYFINIFLDKKWVSKKILHIISDSRYGVNFVKKPKRIVIDYSSPNIAKKMHVGHLRSTIIGDSIARILEFLGHNVIRVNHIGDFGTHLGILIAWIKKYKKENDLNLNKFELFYKKAKNEYENDFLFSKFASKYIIKIQKKDKSCYLLWKKILNLTVKHNQKLYKILNVSLKKENIMGESQYSNFLPVIIKELEKKGIAVSHKGSIVVFLSEFKNKMGKIMGVIIKRKDGAYLYSTIDLACIKYRCKILNANRILYFTDLRQKQHLKQVFSIAKKAGYISENISVEHHTFGMILNQKGKPFKTRSGKNIKLDFLLKKTIQEASLVIKNKNPNISLKDLKKFSKIIGIGSLKYSDLSKNRNTNYIFNWKKMLSFEGNTALYIQYAYIRILSILKKYYKIKLQNLSEIKKTIFFKEKKEIKLAIMLLQFEEIIDNISKTGMPHIMCTYLYKLSVHFTNFYENYPILNEKNKIIRNSRVQLCFLISKILKKGLNLLGIKTVNWM